MDYKDQEPLLGRVQALLRRMHYSYDTEKTYTEWIKRYLRYHKDREFKKIGAQGIEEYLTYLAVKSNVAVSTQNQAFDAILFL